MFNIKDCKGYLKIYLETAIIDCCYFLQSISYFVISAFSSSVLFLVHYSGLSLHSRPQQRSSRLTAAFYPTIFIVFKLGAFSAPSTNLQGSRSQLFARKSSYCYRKQQNSNCCLSLTLKIDKESFQRFTSKI
jgi:hypothetical protein